MGRFKNAWTALTMKSAGSTNSLESWYNLADFLGIDRDTGESMSEATYFACLKVLGESVGKMPCKLLQHSENNGVTTRRDHALYNVVADRPNPYMTASTFWAAVEQNRSHFGNAYVLITGAGSKTQLWVLPSNEVSIWYDDAMRIDKVPDIYYIWATGEGSVPLKSEEVMHFKTSNTLDGIKGISVADQLRMTINGNIKSQQVLDKLYDSGFTAKAVMQYTGSLSDENAQKFVKGIEDYATGKMKNKGIENIIPMPVGATLTPLNMSLTDAQYLDIKKYTALQIASAFGIKPYQIGDYTKESYASQSAQQLAFYVDTLLYIVKQYEEEISYKLLTDKERADGLHFKFNVSVILRADQQTQVNTLSQGVSNFIYTPNEARALLDLESKDGGDELLGNGASIPVRMAGVQYISDASSEDVGGGEIE